MILLVCAASITSILLPFILGGVRPMVRPLYWLRLLVDYQILFGLKFVLLSMLVVPMPVLLYVLPISYKKPLGALFALIE